MTSAFPIISYSHRDAPPVLGYDACHIVLIGVSFWAVFDSFLPRYAAPDSDMLAFTARNGEIVLVSNKTKQWAGYVTFRSNSHHSYYFKRDARVHVQVQGAVFSRTL